MMKLKDIFSKHLTFKRKVTITIILSSIIPFIVIGCIYLLNTWEIKKTQILDLSNRQFDSSCRNINNIFFENNQKFSFIYNNSIVRDTITSRYELVSDLYTAYKNVDVIFEALETNTNYNFRIYGTNNDLYRGRYIDNIKNLDDGIKSQILNDVNDSQFLWKFDVMKGKYIEDELFLCLYRKIKMYNDVIGIGEQRIPFQQVIENFDFEMPPKSFISYVVNNETFEICKGDPTRKEEDINATKRYLSGEEISNYYVIKQDIAETSQKALLFLPKVFVVSQLYPSIFYTLFIALIIIVLIIIAVNYISKALTVQLTNLMNDLNKDIDVLLSAEQITSVKMEDEIGVIYQKMYELIHKIKKYYQQITTYELKNKALELNLLQERINPHFLYNTLSAIKWVSDTPQVESTVDSLVKYYRIALSKGVESIKIEQEVTMLMEYMKLQKFAYDSDFVYSVQIESAMKDYYILKQLLQPFVENAILHGIVGRRIKGEIFVVGKIEGDNLQFMIKDNGIGMSEEKINQVLTGKTENIYNGYGVKNVIDRIKIYYGKEYGVEIKSEIDKGTVVIITISKRLE